MDLSFSDVRAKIDFLQPSDRQNFANALGQTCIHDLRLRRILIIIRGIPMIIRGILILRSDKRTSDRVNYN